MVLMNKRQQPKITAGVLSKVAKAMLPFYRTVSTSRPFAESWTSAVVRADLDSMVQLLRMTSPAAARQGLGTNGIGYFVDFAVPLPLAVYSNGTTIPPGLAQFTFSTKVHRRIAGAVIPLYRQLAYNRNFASALGAAINRGDRKAAEIMVRGLIPARSLRSVALEESGIALTFRYSGSAYPYRNLLFRGIS